MRLQTPTYENAPIFFEYAQEKKGMRVKKGNNYTTFGAPMVGRQHSSPSYRYGFNGKENDPETNTQDYGMRINDPRLGRFLSVDPLTKSFAMLTPYQFASNTPIQASDLDGLEAKEEITNHYNTEGKLVKVTHSITITVTLYNASSTFMTPEEITAYASPIVSGIEFDYSSTTTSNGVTTEYVYNVVTNTNADPTALPPATADANGVPIVGATGFSIVIVDEVKDLKGKAMGKNVTGNTDVIGNTQVNRIQIRKGLDNKEMIRTGAHEMGHALGLRHPKDEVKAVNSDIRSTLSRIKDPENLMRQSAVGSGRKINSSQREQISATIQASGNTTTKSSYTPAAAGKVLEKSKIK